MFFFYGLGLSFFGTQGSGFGVLQFPETLDIFQLRDIPYIILTRGSYYNLRV